MTIRVDITPPGGSTEDLTSRVLFSSTTFTSYVNGAPGDCSVQVRDTGHTENFPSGSVIRLLVDGVVRWAGFVMRVTRTWPFPVLDTSVPTKTPRYWELVGTDWNILFTRRIVRANSPANPVFKLYAPGTYDDTILTDVVTNYTDLLTQDLLTLAIQRISIAVLDVGGITVGGRRSRGAVVWNAGDQVRDVFASVSRATAGIYYITPGKVLTYVDVDTPTSPKRLTDHVVQPDDVGYRSLRETDAGDALLNDALVWGAALGSGHIVFSRVQDATSQALHGRWQGANYSQGLYKQTSADFVASTMVYGTPSSKRGAKDNKRSFECQVDGGQFNLGDKVECSSEVFSYDEVLPVRKIVWTFPTPSVPRQDLLLSYDVDQPWNVYESLFPNFKLPPIPSPQPFPLPQPPGCVLLDSLQRTSSPGWGTASPGPGVWTDTYRHGTAPNAASSLVNSFGGQMTVHVDGPGSSSHGEEVIESLPFGQQEPETYYFQVRLDARPTDNPSSGFHIPTLSFWLDAGAQFRIDQGDGVSTPAGAWITIGGTPIEQITAFSSAIWYNVRFHTRRTTNVASYKVWPVGGTEPAYHDVSTFVSAVSTLAFHWADTDGFYAVPSGPIDLNAQVKNLAIHCEGTVGVPGAGQPFSGPINGEIAVDSGDHMTYTLSRSYVPGSTQVQVNGLGVALGVDYTEVPASAALVFPAPLAASDLVSAAYVAIGGTGVVLQVSSTAAQSVMVAAVANTAIDVIQIVDNGPCTWDGVMIDAIDRSSRPLLIQPFPGHTVRFTGNGSTTAGIFFFGFSGTPNSITFDGGSGAFIFDGIKLSQCGVFELRSSTRCNFFNITFQNLSRDHAFSDSTHKSWCFYISQKNGGGAANTDLVIDRIHIIGSGQSVHGGFGAGSNPDTANVNVTVSNVTVSDVGYAWVSGFASAGILGLRLYRWNLTQCGNGVDQPSSPGSVRFEAPTSGTYSYLIAVSCEPLVNNSANVVSGGGNSGL